MSYHRILHLQEPKFVECERCNEKNPHSFFFCSHCNQAVTPIHFLHWLNAILFAIVAPITISTENVLIYWSLILWIIITLCVIHWRILKYENTELKIITILQMIFLTLVYVIVVKEIILTTIGGENLVDIGKKFTFAILVAIVLFFIVTFIKSCLKFSRDNNLSWKRTFTIFSFLSAFNTIILSFIFNLPFELFHNLKTLVSNTLNNFSFFQITPFSNFIIGFIELSIWFRFSLIVIWILVGVIFYAMVETVRSGVKASWSAFVEHYIYTFFKKIKESIKSVWQIFRYINEAVVLALMPFVLFIILLVIIRNLLAQAAYLLKDETIFFITDVLFLIFCILLLTFSNPLFTLSAIQIKWDYFKKSYLNHIIANTLILLSVSITMVIIGVVISGIGYYFAQVEGEFTLKSNFLLYQTFYLNRYIFIPISLVLFALILAKILNFSSSIYKEKQLL